jgi:hypothetical protein
LVLNPFLRKQYEIGELNPQKLYEIGELKKVWKAGRGKLNPYKWFGLVF